MVCLFSKLIKLIILVHGFSTVWKYTDGYVKQYKCAIYIYWITLL